MKYKFLLPLILSCFLVSSLHAQKGWISLFNGKDIKDWVVKISKHEVGENYAETFRVEGGLLKVKYDGYDQFNQQYGHLFYRKPFSHYLLKLEYRFVGEQVKGGEGWALRNSGAMLHSQAPETMLKDQDFPISVEAQLLGGDGLQERPTGNVCTPGTTIVFDGKLFTPHCLNAKSKTYHGEQWVTAEFLVLGDSVIKHLINKEVVMAYTHPKIGGGNVANYDPKVKTDGKALTSGYIALQSESHPIEFRTVKLYDLSSYVKHPVQLEKRIEKLLQEK